MQAQDLKLFNYGMIWTLPEILLIRFCLLNLPKYNYKIYKLKLPKYNYRIYKIGITEFTTYRITKLTQITV